MEACNSELKGDEEGLIKVDGQWYYVHATEEEGIKGPWPNIVVGAYAHEGIDYQQVLEEFQSVRQSAKALTEDFFTRARRLRQYKEALSGMVTEFNKVSIAKETLEDGMKDLEKAYEKLEQDLATLRTQSETKIKYFEYLYQKYEKMASETQQKLDEMTVNYNCAIEALEEIDRESYGR